MNISNPSERQNGSHIKVGVIGVGFMGALHAKHYAANSQANLVSVVDIDESRAKSIANLHGCAFFTDPEQMIDQVDAVSIAVPSNKHKEVADLAISKGVHILLEKPLAPTVSEAQDIVELANKFGVKLLVGHQERFNSAIKELADRIDMPQYVEAHRHGQFEGRGGDVDVITDLMIHDIDLVLTLIKSPIQAISALGAKAVTPHIDIANARIEFQNGAVANVTASRVANERVRNFKVYANNQYLELDLLKQSMTLTTTTADHKNGDGTTTIQEPIDIIPNLTLKTQIDHFVDIVRNGAAPYVTGEDGLSAVRVAQMIRETVG